MERLFWTSSTCVTPSKFHQTHNTAVCENWSRFATDSTTCPPWFNHCLCLSRLLKYIQFGGEWNGRHADFQTVWCDFTGYNAWFSVNSCNTFRQHLFTLSWTWRIRITDVWEMVSLSDNLRVEWMDSFRPRWVWHQNPPRSMSDQEFRYVRGSCRLHWTF